MASNDTWFNILVSYAWLGGSGNFTKNVFQSHRDKEINLMIDSGAFTLFNAPNNKSYKHIDLDQYCNFLSIYGNDCEKYVMLDKIADEKQSKENYEEMIRRGLNPMFVFTMYDKDYSYLNDAVTLNPDVCVAGGVTTKGDWIRKRFQDVYLRTGNTARIHGLGYVTYPDMFRLPLKSVDSSSWAQSSMMYGTLCWFDNGLKSSSYMDILKKKKVMAPKLIENLEKYKISPKDFSDLSNHRGGVNIALLLSMTAWFEYQKVAKRQGLDLYISIGGDGQLNQLKWINEEYNKGTLTYEKYKNRYKP